MVRFEYRCIRKMVENFHDQQRKWSKPRGIKTTIQQRKLSDFTKGCVIRSNVPRKQAEAGLLAAVNTFKYATRVTYFYPSFYVFTGGEKGATRHLRVRVTLSPETY